MQYCRWEEGTGITKHHPPAGDALPKTAAIRSVSPPWRPDFFQNHEEESADVVLATTRRERPLERSRESRVAEQQDGTTCRPADIIAPAQIDITRTTTRSGTPEFF